MRIDVGLHHDKPMRLHADSDVEYLIGLRCKKQPLSKDQIRAVVSVHLHSPSSSRPICLDFDNSEVETASAEGSYQQINQ